MRIAIMQPTYLPWIGYFDLMDQVDRFVILDNVQFERQSWQQRNRIKTSHGPSWLTVPVVHRFGQTIDETRVDNHSDWALKHWRGITQNYSRAAYWRNATAELEEILTGRSEMLVDLNLATIHWLRLSMGITTPLIRASTLNASGKKAGRLVSICQCLDADEYLSPVGSASYLKDDISFEAAGIRVEFQHFAHPVYRQMYPPFEPYLSALDMLMNVGAGSLDVVRSGRRTSYDQASLKLSLPSEH